MKRSLHEKLKSYHFDVGNSNTGPVGMAGRIVASSQEQAVARLRQLIDGYVRINDGLTVFDGVRDKGVHPDEYLCIYINPEVIGSEDIDEEDELVEPGA